MTKTNSEKTEKIMSKFGHLTEKSWAKILSKNFIIGVAYYNRQCCAAVGGQDVFEV